MARCLPGMAMLLSVWFLAACGAAHNGPAPPPAKAPPSTGAGSNAGIATTASPADPGAPRPARANRGPMLLGKAANGRTVTVRPGGHIEIQLDSTYWRLAPPSSGALTVLAGPSYAPRLGRGCVPGAGCGTVTVWLRAARRGSARVQATRRSCGEAMVCTPAQARYAVTIQVIR